MPDFSGASLRLSTSGDRETLAILDKVDQKAQAVQRQVIITAQQSAEMWKRADGSVHAFNRQVEQFLAQQQAAQAKVAATVAQTAAKVEASALSMTRSTSIGLGELARGIGRVAQSGQVGAMAMREFTGAAFRLSSFAGGELIPVIGLIGYAFVETFEKARRASDEATTKIIDNFVKLADAKDYAGTFKALQTTFSGNPLEAIAGKKPGESDAAFAYRTGGLQGLDALRRQLLAEHPNVGAIQSRAASGAYRAGIGSVAGQELDKEFRDKLNEIDALVKQHGTEYTQYLRLLQQLQTQETETSKAILRGLQEKHALAPAAVATPDAFTDLETRIRLTGRPSVVNPIGTQRLTLLQQLKGREEELQVALSKTNLTYEERLRLENELAQVETQVAGFGGVNLAGMQERIAATSRRLMEAYKKSTVGLQDEFFTQQAQKLTAFAERVSEAVGQTFARGITAGFEAVFAKGGNIGKGFAAMTKTILEGLGTIFEQIGETALLGMGFMAKIKTAIETFTPEFGIPAAIGMIALGAALKAGGARVGANSAGGGYGGGGYGGGGYGGYTSSIIDRGYIDPTAHAPVTNPATISAKPTQHNTFFVIGPDDPRAGRQIQQLLDNNARRG